MTDETTRDAPPVEAAADRATDSGIGSLAVDPESLVDREGVEFCQAAPVENQGHFEQYGSIEGTVAVGVTNAAGEALLMVHESGDDAVLPHAPVETGEDWAAAARSAVEGFAGVPIEVEAVERVRRKHYTPEGDDDRQTTAYDVVLRASPAPGAGVTPLCEENDWTVGWFDGLPVDDPEENEVVDDIRLFL